MQKKNKTNTAKTKSRKPLWIALGVTATAVGTFFGWEWLRGRKKSSSKMGPSTESSASYTTASSTQSTSASSGGWQIKTNTSPVSRDEFPLKKGSKGERVKSLQLALIAKYGKSILPKYGADGDFGSETQIALEKQGLPTQIDESTFNLFVKGAAPDAKSLAQKLLQAATSRNYTSALELLKQIRNTQDYTSVNSYFKEMRIDGDVRKTLVTGMLDTFKAPAQQDSIRMQFLRMGLKYDGSKWALSGLSTHTSALLITTEPAEIIDYKRKIKVQVPANMVLGYFLQSKNGYTLFKTLEKNKKLIIKTSSVKNYESH